MNTLFFIGAACLVLTIITAYVVFYYKNPLGKAIDPLKSQGYFAAKLNPNKVYYATGKHSYSTVAELVGVDKDTLQVIHHNYAKDKRRVYFKHSPIDVDVTSFRVDKNNLPKDARYVYYLDIDAHADAFAWIIDGADRRSYQRIDNRLGWGKDYGHYFYKCKKLPVDYASFEFINDNWAKDSFDVYQLNDHGVTAVGIEVSSLEVLSANVIRDAKRVLFSGVMPGGEDPKGIQLNGFDCVLDKPLELLSECHIRYNNKIYYCGLETAIDANSFQVFLRHERLFHGFSKDKNYVYKYNRKITHIDVQSFRLVGEIMRDKYNRYDADGDIFGSPFQG